MLERVRSPYIHELIHKKDDGSLEIKNPGDRSYYRKHYLPEMEAKGLTPETRKKLKDKAKFVPVEMGKCINLSDKESKELYRLLYKLLGNVGEKDV